MPSMGTLLTWFCALAAAIAAPAETRAAAAKAAVTPPPAPAPATAAATATARPDSNLLWASLRPTPQRADRRGPFVRARGDEFEIVTGDASRPMFVRGVNLGAGAPGRFPGEFAFGKEDYRRYLRFARELKANAIRVYALHPPAFYEALQEENDAHPDHPIWLFQEVWTELPDRNDFWDRSFLGGFEEEIRLTIDAVHGNANVRPRPGHASGRYGADVSRYVAGWLLGREWEPYAVRVTEARHPESTRFRGKYFAVDEGTAMETWLARLCDLAASYEGGRYGMARAVSFVNWPTLDVMRHPTEYERGGVESEHDEDAYQVDPTHIRPIREVSPGAGFLGYFANYHVYPYYPDFMNLDPGYAAHRDRHGACNYAGYLADLKAHTKGLPLLIGEFGVPTSRGVAHLQPQGIHHGGASEIEQGERDVRLLQDIEDAGCAGSLLFAVFDEWFKVNWLVWKMETPRDRDPLWLNLMDAEENYGLIGFNPPPRIHVDGQTSDWAGIAPYAAARESDKGAPLRALYVTSDQERLYLRLDLAAGASNGDWKAFGVSLDVLDPERGDHRLPPPLQATWNRGAEFVLVIEPGAPGGPGARRGAKAELFIDESMNWSGWARLRAGRGFTANAAPFRPVLNQDGRYVPLLIETNRERVSRSGKVYPAQLLSIGRLSYGREPAPARPWPGADSAFAYDPHAEWCLDDGGRVIEVAMPWGLLNIGDPSTRSVVDDKSATRGTECAPTAGIGLLGWATASPGFSADSLGPTRGGGIRPARPEESHFIGPEGTSQIVVGNEIRVSTPNGGNYVWNGWNQPITKERVKLSATFVKQAFGEMEFREQRRSKELDAHR